MTARRIARLLAPKTLHRRSWSAVGLGAAVDVLHEAVHRPFASIELAVPGLTGGYERQRDLVLRSSVAVTRGRAVIEPSEGWVVVHPLRLHERSVIDAEFHPHPSIRRHLVDRLRLPTRRVDGSVASLRTVGEGNHFHLLMEVLGGRVRLLDEHVPGDVPVVVPSWLRTYGVFERALEAGMFAGRSVIFQGQEHLEAERVYVFETSRYDVDSVAFVRRWFDVEPAPPRRRRLFVTRARRSGRALANEGDVVDALRPLGFEVVEPSTLPFPAQVARFADASDVVGIHGAGLTNLVFGAGGARVVELHHPSPSRWGGPPADYFFLSRARAHPYDAVMGSSDGPAAGPFSSFSVDPDAVRAAVERLSR